MSQPLQPASDGRAPDGRFLPGNRVGQGNPHLKKVHRLRAALLAAVTADDIAAVTALLLEKAKGGDLPAIRELLDRTLGKAPQAVALTDADGEPLGLSFARLQEGLLGALADEPAAKLKVALCLEELARAPGPGDGA